jgi:poly-gamma-glutamate synthase PgsB/CapB
LIVYGADGRQALDMWVVVVLLSIILAFGFWEYRSHQFHLSQIPLSIHVNGTRGKSSVTRLIAAGLRSNGRRVFVKTTGTKARMIYVDGREVPVMRVGRPNIIEQIKIVAEAARQGGDVFVTECMGVQPHLQLLLERQFIKSHIGIITNVRADHLDNMGPTLSDVANSLSNTIPRDGTVFTPEKKYLNIIKSRAEQAGAEVIEVDPGVVTEKEMRGFSYIEHRENVAVALEVLRHLGEEREKALAAIRGVVPDPGVVKRFELEIHGKAIEFVNAFAANDPESFLVIRDMLEIHQQPGKTLIVLVNSRKDRIQRAEQLGEFITSHLDADFFVVTGEYTKPLVTRAIACGMPHNKIEDLGGRSIEAVFNSIVSLSSERTLVFGIGNMVGFGEDIVDYFREKGRELA